MWLSVGRRPGHCGGQFEVVEKRGEPLPADVNTAGAATTRATRSARPTTATERARYSSCSPTPASRTRASTPQSSTCSASRSRNVTRSPSRPRRTATHGPSPLGRRSAGQRRRRALPRPLDARVRPARPALPTLGDKIHVGFSAGSMVLAPRIGDGFVGWNPTGGDTALGIVGFSIFPRLEVPDCPENKTAAAEKWAAEIGVPAYATDDQTAIKSSTASSRSSPTVTGCATSKARASSDRSGPSRRRLPGSLPAPIRRRHADGPQAHRSRQPQRRDLPLPAWHLALPT